jgi:hypothetical protein
MLPKLHYTGSRVERDAVACESSATLRRSYSIVTVDAGVGTLRRMLKFAATEDTRKAAISIHNKMALERMELHHWIY